ncbi:hypothetical protein ACLMJK_001004 [Lecanora helva]
MLLHSVIPLLATLPNVFCSSLDPQYIFSNPSSPSSLRIPTVHESAVQARRILNLSSIATLSTVFPSTGRNAFVQQSASISDDSLTPQWSPPDDLSGAPVGLMDYYASCPPQPYSPTILAISIATTFRNTRAGSNVTLSLRWHPPSSAPPSDDMYTYSPANMPRFSLIGYVEPIPASEITLGEVKDCFLARHPDAEAWLPGNKIHESWWGRLVVQDVYWIGGFGDRAYIGWIPSSEWDGVTEKEVEAARLVGEEGYEAHGAGGSDSVY